MSGNARDAAIAALDELARTKVPVPAILERISRQSRLPAEDRQLAMKIIYGVLRNRDYLDHLLGLLCLKHPSKGNPLVHQALRCGLFQLFFLTRMPPSAAVDETVKALKRRRLPAPVLGFVNGVLRESSRRRDQLPGPGDPAPDGRPFLNHPDWLTRRWQDRFGSEAMIRICSHNNREPLLCLRAGSVEDQRNLAARLRDQGVEASAGEFAPEALVVSGPGAHAALAEGLGATGVQVQDQGAQLLSLLLAPFAPGLSVLDACAGLGGKTTHLLALLEGSGSRLSAVEPDPRRYQLLLQNLSRAADGVGVTTINRSLEDFAREAPGPFDRIMLDVPCSGTGVIGRQPDIRWNRGEDELRRYQGRQLALVDQAAALLAPGGVLVYATCSLEAEENDQVVEHFLRHHDDFQLTDCSICLPPSCRRFVRDGCFAPLPEAGIDGFFGARLARRPR